MLQGGCLCGDVTYRIATTLKWITHCHCSMCRKQHGAAFATYASLGRKHLEIQDPKGRLTRFRSSAGVARAFCSRCGSSLFWEHDDAPGLVSVALGTLDSDPGHAPDAHIFAASKASWWRIEDGLPQHPEGAPRR
jgi:hypothetical protein